MKRALILSVFISALCCAHAPSDPTTQLAKGDGVEFLFVPPDPDLGLLGTIPISTHGICGGKGVFADATLSLVIDSVLADGRPIVPDKGKGLYDGTSSPIVIRPDLGFTFQVSQRDLEANFFEWSEKKLPPGFVPPGHGPIRSNNFCLVADKDSPVDVVITYRIRCADMTMSAPMSTRGQNLVALSWRSAARQSNKPLQQSGAPQ
jgi:hypothetical protein